MSDITNIKGIGPKTEKNLNNLGISSINDLINYFPRDYESYEDIKNIIDLEVGKISSIYAMVVGKPSLIRKGKTTITSVWLDDGTGRIRAYWFNIPFINKTLTNGSRIVFRGRVSSLKNGIAISQCKMFKKDIYDSLKGKLSPVYSLTKGIKNDKIKNAIINVLDNIDEYKIDFEEYLPNDIKVKRNLCDLEYAYKHIHFPKDFDDMSIARRRFVYDELFTFSLAMLLNKDKFVRQGREELKNVKYDGYIKYIEKLPFKLTNSQINALNDIIKDFNVCKKMNRLIEGDVGSGKTIVAFLSALLVTDNMLQVAIMTPTEVLAEQHFQNLMKFLSRETLNNKSGESLNSIYRINDKTIALLTGSTKTKDRKDILYKLKSGEIDIVIGTHALFSKDVEYKDLGLCIIDEQHKFGVSQRKALEEKSKNVNVIVMSATPIPRTLAMLIYADMDISYIVDKPLGRVRIMNYVANISEREKGYNALKKQIDLGHQAYVICPSIEKNEDDDIGSFANYQNVKDYAEKLKVYFNNRISIGILHGKMKQNEKYDIMHRFKNGEIQILVSTTVIEVGVDVPNATFILIEDAGAFGLAELHQLRGRVGRGKDQSYALFIDTNRTEKSYKRLKVLMESSDGFYIAEEDMKLRGPGDIFGIKQSGDIDFKLADMYTDIELFKNASIDAKHFMENNTKMSKELKGKLEKLMKLGLVI